MRHPLLHLILLSMMACGEKVSGEACLLVDDDVCPAPDTLSPEDLFAEWDCDNTVIRIESTETPEVRSVGQISSPGCCYDVVMRDKPGGECIVGRPFRHDGENLVAAGPTLEGEAAAWLEIALSEHASIGAFARLQLDLMALGAPLHLLQAVAEALTDEVRHARATLEVAQGYALEPISIGRFPVPQASAIDLVKLAVDTVHEGCIGETLSALATRAAAEANPEHGALLTGIAEDEDRHAALSWGIVAWALADGGEEVREAVIAAFTTPHPPIRFDLLDDEALDRVCEKGLERVIRPALEALLAA